MKLFSEDSEHKWGILTWPMLLLILVCSSLISYYLRNLTNSFLLYLPISISIAMTHWFGWRVLVLSYINAVFTLVLWKSPGSWGHILFTATHEPVISFASYFFCQNLVRQSKGLSNTSSLVKFTILGVVLPDFINSFYTYHYTFINGNMERVALLWLSDFITIISITIPAIHFFKPIPHNRIFKLVSENNGEADLSEGKKIGLRDLITTTLIFAALSFVIDFDKYWFLYGIVATVLAIRNGFDTVVLANLIIFILNYILPLVSFGGLIPQLAVSSQLLSVQIGMGTMLFTSMLIGRVVTDLKKTEAALTEQKSQIEKANRQLTEANREMDRFVYSVSHDISAPLKSIKGLIALGRLEKENFPYIDKIGMSVQKLEDFVGEVLDHSRTSRKEVQKEEVNLKNLITEITDNLVYLENFESITFNINLKDDTIVTDRFLMKVILSNLLSNAIKYQKKRTDESRKIDVRSGRLDGHVSIQILDNGEGIAPAYKDKVFEMFYRGTTNSTGSGLGLFIAKEAVEKLKGKIDFTTEYGVGSEFTITIPV